MLTKEQLTNKYIKYNSLITEEIFDKIINKLVEYFGESNRGMPTKYNNFKNIYNYIQIFNTINNSYSWSLDNNDQNNEEIQVSDILGSDYDIDKPRFEVGKWYKFTGGLEEYISRFKTIRNNNFITDTGYIYNGKYSIDTSNGAIINIDREFTEVPIEEIQQYLPYEHPDKLSKLLTINDLIEGEVCYCLNNTICKWGKNDSTYSINIEDKDFWYNESGACTGKYGFRLATSDEEQWLNVCISEGKFIEKDCALRSYDMYGKPLKSEVDEEFQEGSLIKGEFYNLPGYAIFEAGKDGYIGNGGKDWRPHCDNNWVMIENSVLANSLEKKWVITCRKQKKFIEQSKLDKYDDEGNLIEIKQQFKVGDWIYADRQSDGDFRYELGDSYIPVFKVEEIYKKVEEIYKFSAVSIWLRPVKNKANGIESKYCRFATPEEIANVTKPINKPFEFNKWYKYKRQPKYLTFIHKNGRYGFNTDGDWFDQKEPDAIEYFNKPKDGFVLAEDSEVKERLLSYAKEKYPAGTMFKSALKNDTNPYKGKVKSVGKLDIVVGRQVIWNSNGIGFLYDDGKWAEIISTTEVKEFDRNWYVEVNSQEEVDLVFGWLKSQGEKIKPGKYTNCSNNYLRKDLYEDVWRLSTYTPSKPQKQLSDILPEYKQPIKTEEELSHIIDTNEDLKNEIQGLINQRDFKSSDFVEPIIIKSKKQKRNKLIIVNN